MNENSKVTCSCNETLGLFEIDNENNMSDIPLELATIVGKHVRLGHIPRIEKI